jgi:hypothetical protein
MFCRFTLPLCFLLSNIAGLFAQTAPSRTALLGTWEFQVGGMLKSFTGYTTFKSDGTCLQIGRGKALGLTKWIYVETSWRLDGEEVTASVTRSNMGLAPGTTTKEKVIRLTESAFTYREVGDSEDRTERRVAQLPPDFQAQLAEIQRKMNSK